MLQESYSLVFWRGLEQASPKTLRPTENSLHSSEGNNEKSPWSAKGKIVVLADFLPSAQVVVKKQDSYSELISFPRKQNMHRHKRVLAGE